MYRFSLMMVVCILVIILFNPRLAEPFAVGIDSKKSEPWHTAGGEQLHITNLPENSEDMSVIHHQGQSNEYNSKYVYVNDALAGNDGAIPILDSVEGDTKGGFIINDDHIVQTEKNMLHMMSQINGKYRSSKNTTGKSPQRLDGFGQNRSSRSWNPKDYPLITTNNIDLTGEFPQDSGIIESYNNGEIDELKYREQRGPRTVSSHIEKM